MKFCKFGADAECSHPKDRKRLHRFPIVIVSANKGRGVTYSAYQMDVLVVLY